MTERDMATAREERQIRLAAELKQCDGSGLKRLTQAALAWLEANHQVVNALNVFPVPDGDTGTNMVLTMQAACKEIADSHDTNVSRVAHAVAHGALMGARGNSGVILSQIWRGFARGLGHTEAFDTPLLVRAMREACDTAYRGVVKPVEGTILTVIKETAARAESAADDTPASDLRYMLEQIVVAAFAAVERTPELLPVLKQAGVVDSGGKGLAILLEGMLRYLRGQPLDAAETPIVAPLDLAAVGAAMDAVEPGQEWEVVVDFRPRGAVHLPSLYSRLQEIGTSIQVGEGDGIYRVHVHLLKRKRHEPLDLAEEFGTVVNVHMENLLDQMAPAEGEPAPQAVPLRAAQPGEIGVVAVSPGPGFSRLMGSLGVSAIVSDMQNAKPSTQDILEAVKQLPTERVVVLPNNKDIIMAAQQAASLSTKQVKVVPSRTVPQGIAALLQFVPDGELEAVGAAMDQALKSVETGEITTASRSVEIDGVAVMEGQIIGLHNGILKVADESVPIVLLRLLEIMEAGALELVTLYYGSKTTREAAQAMAEQIGAAFPNLSVEVHAGGQPHYHYILSAE